ncbi:hypothetical protein KA977_07805 [Candidatus Dependentiae bacterium]|nr:hypothetical protein [Candidatus Dependentiae bacterium]
MDKLFYVYNYILFSKNKNIYNIQYYISFKSVLFLFLLSSLSFSTGKLYIKNTPRSIEEIFVFIFTGFILLFFIVLFESIIFHLSALLLGCTGKFKIFFKCIFMTLAPFILYAPASILSVKFSIIFIILVVLWVLILKIQIIKINYNTGYIRSIMIIAAPVFALFLVFSFIAVLIMIFGLMSSINYIPKLL